MINVNVSYKAWIAAMAALRRCEEIDAGLREGNRWKEAHQEFRAAALMQVAREIEYANPPEPGQMFLRRQGE